MKSNNGNRAMLVEAEEELRRAILAERAGIKNAGQRRQRAEIEVEKWRQRARVNDIRTSLSPFGPDDENEGLS